VRNISVFAAPAKVEIGWCESAGRWSPAPLQYPLLSGITPRTPPRGSSMSPAYRGITCTCITVCPAAVQEVKERLKEELAQSFMWTG